MKDMPETATSTPSRDAISEIEQLFDGIANARSIKEVQRLSGVLDAALGGLDDSEKATVMEESAMEGDPMTGLSRSPSTRFLIYTPDISPHVMVAMVTGLSSSASTRFLIYAPDISPRVLDATTFLHHRGDFSPDEVASAMEGLMQASPWLSDRPRDVLVSAFLDLRRQDTSDWSPEEVVRVLESLVGRRLRRPRESPRYDPSG